MVYKNVIFIFLICMSGKVFAVGDDLVANELCGTMVDSGSDPCESVREINLYSAVRYEEYNDVTKISYSKIDDILKIWVIDNNEKFLSKKINIYHKSKRAPLGKGSVPERTINIYFWSVEIKDKKMLDVIFFSRSMHGHIVTSRQCDLGNDLNVCLAEIVNDLLEENVTAQIFKYPR